MKRVFVLAVALGLGTLAATYSGTVGPYGVTITEPTAGPTARPTVAPTVAPTIPPSPTPSVPPATGNVLPWVYSQIFTSNTPFHTPVSALHATVVNHTYMDSLWNQGGVSGQDLGTSSYYSPVYVSSASDPTKTVSCTGYGACNANGLSIHVPAGAVPEPQSDGHIGIIDTVLKVEVDLWNCHNSSNPVACTWGGKYPLSGTGITNSGSEAFHGGYSVGVSAVTAQELLNGHIDHALAMNTKCLNNPTLYPADPNNAGTDQACSGGGSNPPHYGNLMHLLWTPAQIASSSYSGECKTILTALATYGAYLYDTGNPGLSLLVQGALSYTAIGKSDPWATTIIPHLKAAGDANGAYWNSCLNRLSSSSFELLAIPAGPY